MYPVIGFQPFYPVIGFQPFSPSGLDVVQFNDTFFILYEPLIYSKLLRYFAPQLCSWAQDDLLNAAI